MPIVSVDPGSRRHEGGKTLVVIGALLVIWELIAMNWIGWDVRAGNWFMQAAMGGVGLIAVVLIVVGWSMQHSASV